MTKEWIRPFYVARDFDAFREIFTRALSLSNKESRLYAIYKVSEKSTKQCNNNDCAEIDKETLGFGDSNKADFELLFEYPFKDGKPKYMLYYCKECLFKEMEDYLKRRLDDIKEMCKGDS